MAELSDIREGLAALLRAAMPADEGQVSAYLIENPTTPCLQVAGYEEIENTDFGDGRRLSVIIEGCFALTSDIRPQQLLDSAIDLLPAAVESDSDGEGALYSRLSLDGVVTSGQPAAAQSVGFDRYQGSRRFVLKSGPEVLLATWLVEVLA